MIARLIKGFKGLETWLQGHNLVFFLILGLMLAGTYFLLERYKEEIVAPKEPIKVIKGPIRDAVVIGDRKSKRYYLPWCFQVSKIPISTVVVLESAKKAQEEGYGRVKACNVVIG